MKFKNQHQDISATGPRDRERRGMRFTSIKPRMPFISVLCERQAMEGIKTRLEELEDPSREQQDM